MACAEHALIQMEQQLCPPPCQAARTSVTSSRLGAPGGRVFFGVLMGRPSSRDAPWFPFYIKDGRTLTILLHKHGLAGIGFFTQMMRLLTGTPDHYLCLRNEVDELHTFVKLGCDPEEAAPMIELMVLTGKLNKELWEQYRVLHVPDLVDSLDKLYTRRDMKPPTSTELIERFSQHKPSEKKVSVDNNAVDANINAHSRVEESRGENSSVAIATGEPARPPVKPPNKLKDPVAQHIDEKMRAVHPYENFARERGQIKIIVARCKRCNPDDPIQVADVMMSMFAWLRENGDKFWRKQPFLPSVLSSLWERIEHEGKGYEDRERKNQEGGEFMRRFLSGEPASG